ncbi:MAG TPA: DNA polymerase III subunit delta' [bacterium]|nr:DNA polymerase III subunit delta' [bacterium]
MSNSSVLGHERARAFLFSALVERRVAHAYLFAGPARIGKKLMALTFAKGILCAGGPEGPCGDCPSCQKVSRGAHPDLLLVEPQADPGKEAKSLKIEQVRDLQRAISLKAHEGGCKIAIIDDAELLTEQAGNALLKVIEEPPSSTYFILIAGSLNSLLPTLVSRCQIVPFIALSEGQVAQLVRQTRGLEPQEADLRAALSRGQVGRALDMDMELREELLSLAFLLLAPSPGPWVAGLQSQLQNLGRERQTFEEFLRLFLLLSRDLMALKSGAAEAQVVNRDKIPEMRRINLQLSPAVLGRIAAMISETLGQLRANAYPQLALEALAVRIALGRACVKESYHV